MCKIPIFSPCSVFGGHLGMRERDEWVLSSRLNTFLVRYFQQFWGVLCCFVFYDSAECVTYQEFHILYFLPFVRLFFLRKKVFPPFRAPEWGETPLRAVSPRGEAGSTIVNSTDFTKKHQALQIQYIIFPHNSITCYFIALFHLIKTVATKSFVL